MSLKQKTAAESSNASSYSVPIKHAQTNRIPQSQSMNLNAIYATNTYEKSAKLAGNLHHNLNHHLNHHHVHYDDAALNQPLPNSILKHAKCANKLSEKEHELLRSTHRERRNSHVLMKLMPTSSVYLESGQADFDDNISFSDSSFAGDIVQNSASHFHKPRVVRTVLKPIYSDRKSSYSKLNTCLFFFSPHFDISLFKFLALIF